MELARLGGLCMRYALLLLVGLLSGSTEYPIIRYPAHKNKNNRFYQKQVFELIFTVVVARDLDNLGPCQANWSVECMVHSLRPEQINVALPRASTITKWAP